MKQHDGGHLMKFEHFSFFSPIVAKAAYMDVLILTLYRNHSYHIHDQMQFASEEQPWNVVLPLVR